LKLVKLGDTGLDDQVIQKLNVRSVLARMENDGRDSSLAQGSAAGAAGPDFTAEECCEAGTVAHFMGGLMARTAAWHERPRLESDGLLGTPPPPTRPLAESSR